MRLHHLQIRAFGPFGGTEAIDFDALGAHGLFLMHGATGSGKTTVLDAVCFALFAAVPGARRSQTERLVSDHAQPGTSPEVRLEFTVAQRRLRITRSPKHLVTKKRGHGQTPRQAKVLLEERLAGRWTALSTRADETAEILDDLIGLGLDQFAQVVLLPQGEFAAFLRAKADDRAALLQRLFDISRFADLETWLADRRRTVRAQVTENDRAIHTAVVRAEESLVDLAPQIEQWRGLPVDALPAAVTEAAAATSTRLSEAMALTERTATALDAAVRTHEQADALLGLQRKGAAAAATWAQWEAQDDERASAEGVLAAHRRAARVMPSVRAAERAAVRHRTAGETAAPVQASLETAGIADPDQGTRLLADGREPLSQALEADRSAWLAEQQLPARNTAVETARTAVGTLATTRTRLDERLAVLTTTITTARQTSQGAADLQHRKALLDEWRGSTATLRDAERRDARAVERVTETARRYAEAEAEVIDLRTRRLAGFAGELALDLQPGTPCPVCGSAQHPHPASSAAGVGADDVAAAEQVARSAADAHRAAEREQTAARTTVVALAERQASLAEQWAALTGASLEPSNLTTLQSDLATQLEDVARAREVLAAAEQEHAALEARRLDLEQEQRRSEQAVVQATAERDSLRQALQDAVDRRAEALGRHREVCACARPSADTAADDPADDPALAHRRHRDLEQLLEQWTTVSHQVSATQQSLTEARTELDRQLEDEGFSGVDEARAALLSTAAEAELVAQLRSARDAAQQARGVLDQPDVVAAMAADPADPAGALALRREAQSADRQAREQFAGAKRAAASLERLAADVDRLLAESRADRESLPVLDRVADLTTGAGDNQLRMRLSAYVLAARLEQVTTLANHQLEVMSAGRYRLEHTDAKAKGGARSGLGLHVRDSWTGTARDTATLSGGETFMVSLALALALGEAVLHDAGGRPLETLLVDEGFGSLDDESLELVMQVLDDLRSGGRTVGIVSHVSELRSRVPAQIRVHKTEQGSRVEVHVGDASSAA